MATEKTPLLETREVTTEKTPLMETKEVLTEKTPLMETKEVATEKTPLMETQEVPTEKTPLMETMEALRDGYGLNSHAKFVPTVRKNDKNAETLVDYEPLKLSTFRVFCLSKGTILQDPVLLVEQLLITLIFVASAVPVYYYFKLEWTEGKDGDGLSLRRWLSAQEGKMRAFAMIMTNLAAFLLSFYTAISVARWWAMRTGGVGRIKAATVDLEWLLYQNVTQEEEVLSAVRRYGRASLLLIFLWRQGNLAHMKEELTSRGLLYEHEVDKLFKWNHCLHETIWAWQSGIVTMLYKEGKINDELFDLLLRRCTEGRAAVQLVHTHLAVRVPMQYIHLLGLLVKMHNCVLAVVMGAIFAAALRNSQAIICVQTFARTLILPFLFNAILLINVELADPFSGGDTDFPGLVYQGALDKDCKAFVSATDNMPDWVTTRSETV